MGGSNWASAYVHTIPHSTLTHNALFQNPLPPPPLLWWPCCRVQTTAADWIGANLEGGKVIKEKNVGGSNWASAYVYTTQGGQEYFVKVAMGGRDDSMFQGEAQGLQAMYGECDRVRRGRKGGARAWGISTDDSMLQGELRDCRLCTVSVNVSATGRGATTEKPPCCSAGDRVARSTL